VETAAAGPAVADVLILPGIDSGDIIETVHARRAPMIPVARRCDSDPRAMRVAAVAQSPHELTLSHGG
jgi:hypothetical protein